MFSCQRCRQSLDIDTTGKSNHHTLPLGESYVVLPQPRHPEGSALPDLSDGLGRGGPVLQATSMHEQLRTVGRLLDLSERAKPIECGVPLCDDCASGVLRELQRRLEEAHAEKQLLQAAFAEIEVGEEDDANEAPFTDESFAREVEAQEREEAELRTSLSAAKSEREELRKELKRLQVQRDEGGGSAGGALRRAQRGRARAAGA